MTVREDTGSLSLPGGRKVGTPGHELAVSFLERRMAESGLSFYQGESYRLPYRHGGREFTNLAGSLPGRSGKLKPLLLGAHYDSAIEGPCSDDNAVAVALLLDLAPGLRTAGMDRTIVFAFFDAEERPFFGTEAMGSVRFAEEHSSDFSAAVILDAVGHDFELMVPLLDRSFRRIREFIFVSGAEDHPSLPGPLEESSSSIRGLRVIPVQSRYTGQHSDDMAFRRKGVPCLFISRGNGRHTHTPGDDMEWVNFHAVSRVRDWVTGLLVRLDRACLEDGDVPGETLGMEIRMLKRAAGVLLPGLLLFLGIRKPAPRTREDMDLLAFELRKYLKIK